MLPPGQGGCRKGDAAALEGNEAGQGPPAGPFSFQVRNGESHEATVLAWMPGDRHQGHGPMSQCRSAARLCSAEAPGFLQVAELNSRIRGAGA